MVPLEVITMLSTAHVPLSLLVQGILSLRTLEFHQGGSGIRVQLEVEGLAGWSLHSSIVFQPNEVVKGKNRNSFNISASVCFVFFACACVHACSIV